MIITSSARNKLILTYTYLQNFKSNNNSFDYIIGSVYHLLQINN